MKLIIKIHPRYITWLLEVDKLQEPVFSTLLLQPNMLKNYENIKQLFSYLNTKYKTISFVGFENPHIELTGQPMHVIRDIQHMQRTVAIIIVLAWEALAVQANSLIHTTKLSKTDKLALAEQTCTAGLKMGFYSDLEKLCLAECIMLLDTL